MKDVVERLRAKKTPLTTEAADAISHLRHLLAAEKDRRERAELRAAGRSMIVRAEGGKGHGTPES